MKSQKNSIQTFLKLPENAKHTCLLYSKQRSILAYNPKDKFISNNDIEGLKKFIKKHRGKQIVGYLSYDLAYQLYNIKQTAKNDLKLPNIYFLAFDKWEEFENNRIPKINLLQNNLNKQLAPHQTPQPPLSRGLRAFPPDKGGKPRYRMVSGKGGLMGKEINLKFDQHAVKFNLNKKYTSTNFKPIITKQQYKDAYKKIKKYIKEGEIYQINFTHRLEGKTEIPPRLLHAKILEKNPVDFTAYMEGDGFEILSASPERFIKINGKTIITEPIKGTRPRGKTKQEDEKLKKELLASEKETAELNMITDLLRNDVGKISKFGSVQVSNHRLIQKLPSVWHTYSKITGEISVPPIDALLSMFPGGSITGCPKKRAIKIIDKLETHTRGVYTGSIGHIEPNGDLDFNIAIRTIIKKNDKLYLQVGGGIVMDSDQKSEFEETLSKTKSFMEIL